LSFTGATSEEFVPNVEKPVIVFMPEISKTHMGGTMRLGLRPTVFESGTENSLARKLYAGAPTIWERHRHRYEVNPALVNELSVDGFNFIGKDEKGERMQILELESESVQSVLSISQKLYETS
jgi:CTP synthase